MKVFLLQIDYQGESIFAVFSSMEKAKSSELFTERDLGTEIDEPEYYYAEGSDDDWQPIYLTIREYEVDDQSYSR